MNSTATHRVFDALAGLYPVTFANVIEADPRGLLDIFEGADNTRDAYFDCLTRMDPFAYKPYAAGMLWADHLTGYFDGHDSDCDIIAPGNSGTSYGCVCRERHYNSNRIWGTELYEAIEQRIDELNG